jgi:outer membrane protein assembly factor BamE (lipoprotein component of BamABCDE complex)
MNWTRKRAVILVIALAGLFCLELGREQLVYMYVRSSLEHGYWQVRPSMTREQVTETLGQPDRVEREGASEIWHWDARTHQGWLWNTTRLASLKKHYQLSVSFNEQGVVADVFAESK